MSITRKYKLIKKSAIFLSFLILSDSFIPTISYALTSGPSQPEVQSFEPFGTSEMVDLFSGDFTYNIPLFELPGPNGGYPFNLAYHSGIGMDQEASWVGLGWSLNPGAINRNMRGLPDDFDGDLIKKTQDLKKNWTAGANMNFDIEPWAVDLGKGQKGIGTSVGIGLKIYYNSYKGVGYALQPGVGFNITSESGMTGSLGLNLSLDSQEDGATISPSLSISQEYEDEKGNTIGRNGGTAAFSFNSNRGLTDLSLGISASGKSDKKTSKGTSKRNNQSVGHSISFANTSYTPTIGTPMKGWNASLNIKGGGDLFGVVGAVGLGGYYSEQTLAEPVTYKKAYGYMNLENADLNSLLDFNREKDGPVRKNSPNLPIPSLTYDAYSVQGQGVGGMYRPFRNDIGAVYDPYMISRISGGALGFEFAIGATNIHPTVNGDINHTESESGKWLGTYYNDYDYKASSPGSLYEAVYFKRPGEAASENSDRFQGMAGGTKAMSIKIDGTGNDPELSASFQDKSNSVLTNVKNNIARESVERKPRNLAISPVRNEELQSLGEFKNVKYYNTINNYNPDPANYLDRDFKSYNNKDHNVSHHIGGISVCNNSGSRYNYGLPAYNNYQEEVSYSVSHKSGCRPTIKIADDGSKPLYHVDKTDEFFSKTEIPPYAHSYLLTSIYGPDYVDLENDGPTDDDFGYWVKFHYVKTTDNYQWKAPFEGANHIKGYNCDIEDNKGSYLYGSKEVWYLAKAETKSHIAIFEISSRKDAKGVSSEFQNSEDPLGQSYYKLDKISLYTKKDYEQNPSTAKLIKSVKFEYNYELCKEVKNNTGVNDTGISGSITNAGGKLTLKKIWFENGESQRGRLNPYKFNYDGSLNPNYNTHTYDRWGNYKPYHAIYDSCHNIDFPYVDQNENIHEYASAWNLSEIILPSGGKINLEYESDDYAYVQNKRAMQMMEILGTDETNPVEAITTLNQTAELYDNNKGKRKLYFKLDEKIPITSADTTDILNEYFEGLENLYYKVFLRLRKPSESFVSEYIQGYAEIDKFGFNSKCEDGNDFYSKAYVILKPEKDGYHPFTLAGLQLLRYTLPKYSNTFGFVDEGDDEGKIKQAFGLLGKVKDLFTNYYASRTDIGFCSEIVLGKSWLRLNKPDKIKYGGGVRVKKISINDNWNDTDPNAESSEYGQVYEYTTVEKGDTISSGVAIYEPILGGDENPLKYAKEFPLKTTMIRIPQNLIFEFPVNESYYPAASVGYSKVTVKSLNTNEILSNSQADHGYSSTGVTVHEFYTAKEFPIITDETTLEKSIDSDHMKTYDLIIPLFGMGQLTTHKLAASQGYYLELNDMHGKLKTVSNYAIDGEDKQDKNPYSWVQYNYFVEEYFDGGAKYYKPFNELPVLLSDQDPDDRSKAEIETRLVGVDYEVFSDTRYFRSKATNGGVNFNVETTLIPPFFIPIPIPLPWPNIGLDEKETRLAVTNKIVNRVGILKETIAYNDGSIVRTENKLFDALTGRPLLTIIDNDFDNPVYSYNIPAAWKYDGMDAAYRNLGLRVSAPVYLMSDNKFKIEIDSNPGAEHLIAGDEVVIMDDDEFKKGYITNIAGFIYFRVEGNVSNTLQEAVLSNPSHNYEFLVVRSGRRNLLDVDAASIVSLANPTTGREDFLCQHVYDFDTTGTTDYDSCLTGCFNSILATALDSISSYSVNNPITQTVSECSDLISFTIHNTKIELMFADSSTCFINVYDEFGNQIDMEDIFNNPHTFVFSLEYSGLILPPFNGLGTVTISQFEQNPDNYYVGSRTENCMCIEEVDNSPGIFLVIDTLYHLDSILQVEAKTFKNSWPKFYNEIRTTSDESGEITKEYLKGVNDQCDFTNGKRGIWKLHQSWAYLKHRQGMESIIDNPQLYSDGIFDIIMFNWDGSQIANDCEPAWVRANTITKYNNYGFEIENKNVLDNYSSALYGYSGSLATAVVQNAKYEEFAFEGFEEQEAGVAFDQFNGPTGHISIYTEYTPSSYIEYNEYPCWGWVGTNFIETNNNVVIPPPSQIDSLPTFELTTIELCNLNSFQFPLSPQEKVKFHLKNATPNEYIHEGNTYFKYEIEEVVAPAFTGFCTWKGILRVPRKVTPTTEGLDNCEITDQNAHTGYQSLLVTDSVSFWQSHLQINPVKNYAFSAWIKRDNNDVPFYPGDSSVIVFTDVNETIVSDIHISGELIEGWQKIEGIIKIGTTSSRIKMNIDIKGAPLYIDDIRIYPANSTMQSYVYDKRTYRLSAILDNNNYATFYHYDENGNLFLVDKETERGIKTLQESRAYKTPNN